MAVARALRTRASVVPDHGHAEVVLLVAPFANPSRSGIVLPWPQCAKLNVLIFASVLEYNSWGDPLECDPMAGQRPKFNPKTFLSTVGSGRTLVSFRKGQTIYAQGDASDAVFVIQTGSVRLSARSQGGREATLDILGDKDFCWDRFPIAPGLGSGGVAAASLD